MTIILPTGNCTGRLFTLLLVLLGTTLGWSAHPDPTTPSGQIVEQLALETKVPAQPTSNGDNKTLSLDCLRLRGIVLRDRQNGTALVSVGDQEVYVITLRREDLHAQTNRLNVRGVLLEIRDFSQASILVKRLDTNQLFIIN